MESLCGHTMPTEYADYVTFVFGYVHVWCCHMFVCLCIECIVKGQRAGTCIREVPQVSVVSYVPPI